MENGNIKFLTIVEAARQLQVNPDKLRRWANQGVIEAVCLLSTKRRMSLRIKQETIYAIFVRAIVQEELERTYEQEAQERYEASLRDYEPDAMDAL